jgi:hypothetical protein
MTPPTRADLFAQIDEHIIKLQELTASMAHLYRAEFTNIIGSKDRAMADGWLAMSEAMKLMRHQVIQLQKGKFIQ